MNLSWSWGFYPTWNGQDLWIYHDLGDFTPLGIVRIYEFIMILGILPHLELSGFMNLGYLGLALVGILERFKLPTKMGPKWIDPTSNQTTRCMVRLGQWYAFFSSMEFFFCVPWHHFFFARYTLRSSNVASETPVDTMMDACHCHV